MTDATVAALITDRLTRACTIIGRTLAHDDALSLAVQTVVVVLGACDADTRPLLQAKIAELIRIEVDLARLPYLADEGPHVH